MPARRERQQTQQTGGPVWQPVHRFAFIQRLMKDGFMKRASAIDIFEQLTGSDSGGLPMNHARGLCVFPGTARKVPKQPV